MRTLIRIASIFILSAAFAELRSFEIPYGDGEKTVQADYDTQKNFWTIHWPSILKADLVLDDQAKKLLLPQYCQFFVDDEIRSYKENPSPEAKKLLQNNIRGLGGLGSDQIRVQWNLSSFHLNDPLFIKKATKIARQNSWTLEGLPSNEDRWWEKWNGYLVEEKVQFEWDAEARSRFLGIEELEKDFIAYGVDSGLGHIATTSGSFYIETQAKDFLCDLLQGRLQIEIPLKVFNKEIVSRQSSLSSDAVIDWHKNLRGILEDNPLAQTNTFLKHFYLVRSFRESTRLNPAAFDVSRFSQSYRDFFDSFGRLKGRWQLDLEKIIENFTQENSEESSQQVKLQVGRTP